MPALPDARQESLNLSDDPRQLSQAQIQLQEQQLKERKRLVESEMVAKILNKHSGFVVLK